MRPEYQDDLVEVYTCDHADLAAHLRGTGRTVDALITDCPYSERTHAGHDDGAFRMSADGNARGADYRSRVAQPSGGTGPRRTLNYGSWTEGDVDGFVARWASLNRGWWISLTDHVLARAWEFSLEAAGMYVFSPLACAEIGSRVRLGGDGPTQWSTWAVAARPRTAEFNAWGSLPGAYVAAAERKPWVGGKPVWLIRALVRDYSRPGDLIVDPCCGAGTLGVAVRYEGRRAILADKDPAAVETTIKRLRGERTKPTRDDFPETETQPSLFGGVEKNHDGGAM